MKKVAKIIIVLLVVIELGLLTKDVFAYTQKGICQNTINGRIIVQFDDIFKFSKWSKMTD